jgi:hypothetical protein
MRGAIIAILFLILIKPIAAVIVIEGGNWAIRQNFESSLTAKKFKINLDPSNMTFMIRQRNGAHSSLDRIAIFADDKIVRPKTAKQNGLDVNKKVGGSEKNVVDIHENPVDVMFEVPKAKKYVLEVTANEYDDRASILRSPKNGFMTAKVFNGTMNIDGVLDKELGPYSNPIWWILRNGRQQTFTYSWFKSDGQYIYAAVEATGDNTNTGNQRASLIIQMPDRGFEKFTIDASNKEYGKAGFQYTNKAAWEHKIFEFKIPFKGTPNTVKYAIEYQLI